MPRWACVTTYFLLNSMDYKCKSTICGRLLQDIGIQDNEQDIEPGGQRSRKRAVVDFGRAHEESRSPESRSLSFRTNIGSCSLALLLLLPWFLPTCTPC